MRIESVKQLREIYNLPSGRAKDKTLTHLDKHAINYISKSPFLLISSISKNGLMDNSPRGGAPGFSKVINNQIIIPDSKGNNRMDSITNIIETGRVGLLYLLPGIDETLRINGRGHLTTDHTLLSMFSKEKNPPKSCIVIDVEEIFLHCAKALMRSKLWKDDYKIERPEFPTMGQMLKDQLKSTETPESYEEMVKRYSKDL